MQVGEASTLPQPHLGLGHLGGRQADLASRPYLGLDGGHVLEAVQEPSGDASGHVAHVLDRVAAPEGLEQGAHAPVGGDPEPVLEQGLGQGLEGPLVHRLASRGVGHGQRPRVRMAVLEARPRLEKGLLEAAPYGHDLACRLHRCPDGAVGGAELVEGPARYLDHAVVEGRLEGRCRALAGDRVGQLVEGVADRDERGYASDRVARRLRCEGRGAGDAGVDLDDAVLPGRLLNCELHVASAPDVQPPDELEGRVAQHLVVAVRQRLLGCNHHRLAGVDAHRVEVLHGAHDDGVVGAVAHHLVLVLLPAQYALFDEHLTDRRVQDALAGYLDQFTGVVGRPAA